MVTMTDDGTTVKFSAAFAFSFISIVRILTIHEILKVFLPLLAFRINRNGIIFGSIDGRSVARQTFVFTALL